ncbi:reticulon-like protein B17 [Andrographis paniculata]|uniref:reticulon-like protein B17 n=1 Tax=Andrographis paniculata TaxID=175694 RepID=UPI0021E76DBF|nr:reticulon-like protein B17 [Andrographis paniculata]
MDDSTTTTTPHHRTQPKSASRLSKLRHYSQEEGGSGTPTTPQLSLEIVQSSSPKISTPSPASTVSPKPPYSLPLQDLLLLSPSPSPSPLKRSSKSRLLDMAEDAAIETAGVRKRCKTRNSASGCAAAASPRGGRRSRRRLEQDAREERELAAAGGDVSIKPRKKKTSERSRTGGGDGYNLNATGEAIHDLIMWKDVSKSSLWFGLGSLSIMSSCFVKGVHYSMFSFMSQVGLLFLGLSFFSNTMRQREGKSNSKADQFKLKEEDILRFGRLILPAANLAISKTREIFSGEPAMTLKVIPIFLLGAEYGHCITLWRLCALGFFISFTAPKLYSTYSSQLDKKVEYLKQWAMDIWEGCTHKKIVAASAVMAFWNLTSIRTRIFAAFLSLVIVRYRRQHLVATEEDNNDNAGESKLEVDEEERALVAVETESKK